MSLDLPLGKKPQRIPQGTCFQWPRGQTFTVLCLAWRSWLVLRDLGNTRRTSCTFRRQALLRAQVFEVNRDSCCRVRLDDGGV